MTNDINNTQDILDVRDIIARVEEMEIVQENEQSTSEHICMTTDEIEEFKTLNLLLANLAGNGGDEEWRGDWYPVTMIRDSYFETAIDELLEDIGELPKDVPCYLKITVDYNALKMDYSSVEFDGVTYWYR